MNGQPAYHQVLELTQDPFMSILMVFANTATLFEYAT